MAARPEAPSHYFNVDEYFALEHGSDARFEYWDGEILCKSGGSRAHYRIAENIFLSLAVKLKGGPCSAIGGETPIKTPSLLPTAIQMPRLSVANVSTKTSVASTRS